MATGPERDAFVERYELQPIDPQTNGPQLYYGLRYDTHIVKPGKEETFHDQVGYWLWAPAAKAVALTLAIPRAQVPLAAGPDDADPRDFELTAAAGLTRVAAPSLNPLARLAAVDGSLGIGSPRHTTG